MTKQLRSEPTGSSEVAYVILDNRIEIAYFAKVSYNDSRVQECQDAVIPSVSLSAHELYSIPTVPQMLLC